MTRELSPELAKPILKDLRSVAKSHGTFAQFDFEWLQKWNIDVFDLALVLDGAKPPERIDSFRLVDLARASRNWIAIRGRPASRSDCTRWPSSTG